MELSPLQTKQSRLRKMAKGVVAAALAIDQKFRAMFGEPIMRTDARGKRVFAKDSPYRTAMVTLTYRKDGMWRPEHVSELINHYRLWFKRHGGGVEFHYVWVLEFTEIGRPHYHLVCWLPKGVKPPLPDKQGWWKHGMSQAIYATSPVGYIAKYASKGQGVLIRDLPQRMRLWGYGGLKMSERGPVSMALAPAWLRQLVHHESHVQKRAYERLERPVEQTARGPFEFCARVVKKVGWYVKAGLQEGFWFFGPWELDGFTDKGIHLAHRGVVEIFDGWDSQFIPIGR